jgi:hypothetical protein
MLFLRGHRYRMRKMDKYFDNNDELHSTAPSGNINKGERVFEIVRNIKFVFGQKIKDGKTRKDGINHHRTKKVGTCLAFLERKFHGSDILEDYCRVEVMMVIQGSEDDMIDIIGSEGIETLGQAIKNFILWRRRDVEL